MPSSRQDSWFQLLWSNLAAFCSAFLAALRGRLVRDGWRVRGAVKSLLVCVHIWTFVLAPKTCACIEGEYAMGEGFGESVGLCCLVLTYEPSFWRPKPDRLLGLFSLPSRSKEPSRKGQGCQIRIWYTGCHSTSTRPQPAPARHRHRCVPSVVLHFPLFSPKEYASSSHSSVYII